MKDIAYLAEKIGPRPAGTREEYRAGSYLKRRFDEIGLKSYFQPFYFMSWRPLDKPVVHVLAPGNMELAASSMYYTLSTPPAGVTGRLRRAGRMELMPNCIYWPKYELVDAADGRNALGFLVNCGHETPFPLPAGRSHLPQPGAIIGAAGARQLDRWLDEGVQVEVCLHNEGLWGPELSRNVIGLLGDAPPKIVFLAHYDTALGSPGAVDNASGIRVLLELAQGLIGSGRKLPAIAFIATGCEEPGFFGSENYVRYFQEHEEPANHPAYCVNLDMLANGEKLLLRTGGDAMRAHVEAVAAGLADKLRFGTVLEPAKPLSDNWPFHVAGIQNVQMGATAFPLYHMPGDVVAEINPALLEDASLFAGALAERLISEYL